MCTSALMDLQRHTVPVFKIKFIKTNWFYLHWIEAIRVEFVVTKLGNRGYRFFLHIPYLSQLKSVTKFTVETLSYDVWFGAMLLQSCNFKSLNHLIFVATELAHPYCISPIDGLQGVLRGQTPHRLKIWVDPPLGKFLSRLPPRDTL